jgi:hypothetical protein
MYLEISNVAAALGKNPYESKEKTLLVSWARHCPDIVKNFLIENNCIVSLKQNEESFSDLQIETYNVVIPEQYDVKDFDKIEKKVVEEYKRKRNNEQSEKEIKQLKEYTQDLLKKNNGNIQENNIIQKEQYKKGNDKMYYYEILPNACIGGKNDASIGDVLLEIKTRTRRQNVRRNEYDLYQLICYLLATSISQGKIVQLFNKEKFDSNLATEQEYGLVDITQDPWKELSMEIVEGLKEYFNELSELIKTSKFIYLTNVIPKRIRPIAKYLIEENDSVTKKIILCEENIKFKNLFRHVTK